MTPRVRWAAALAVVAFEALHVRTKLVVGDPLVEMLWWCHLAAFAIAAGLALRQRHALAAGTLFYVALGLPLYLFDVAAGGVTTWTSALVHVAAPVLGVWGMRDHPWPRLTWLATGLLLWPPLLVARLFTDPALNINVAHRMYWEGDPRPLWLGWLTNFAALLLAMWVAQKLLERATRR